MTKQPKLFIGMTALAILSFPWNFAFAQGAQTSPGPGNEETVAPANEEVSPETPGNEEAAPPKEWGELKDPFESYLPSQEKEESSGGTGAPQAGEEAATFDYSSLVVTGIVWGTENPKAIINGNVLGKGDTVNGGEIIDISKEGILFKYKDKEYLMKRQSAAVNPENTGGGK